MLVAVVALYGVSLYKVCNPTVETPYPLVYHGPSHRQRPAQSKQDFIADMPQPSIKPVNVSLTEYHAKAKVYQNKYAIEQQITKYNSQGGGITLGSTATMHSYGGGGSMSGMYNRTNFANNNITNSVNSSFYNIRQTDAYPAVQSTLYNYRPNLSFTYRAAAPDIVSLLNQYRGINSIGVEERGGKYYYEEFWIDGFYIWLKLEGYTDAALSPYSATTLVAGQDVYLLKTGTTPPPHNPDGDEFPIGDGISVLLILLAGYMIIKRKKTSLV